MPRAWVAWRVVVGAAYGLAAGVYAAGADKHMLAEAERVISPFKTVMEEPPRNVPSRDVVDGPLLGNGDMGAVISGKPDAQRYWISKNNFWRLKDGHRQGGPRLFGGLEINMPALSNATYRIEQHIYPAITISSFSNSACAVTMRSLVAATGDFLLVELSVAGAPVDVDTKLWAAPGRGSVETNGNRGSVSWVTKAFFNQPDWQLPVKPTSAACALAVVGAKGSEFRLEPGRTVTVAVAMQSSFDAKDPLAAAQDMAVKLNGKGVKRLLAEHARWWQEFWAHSLVEIGDPFLEQEYYVASYLMGSGTRDKDFPTGLYGLWVTSDDPRWAGDYHLNFDYQSQYYGLYKCNLLEQADTFEQPVLDFMERGRWYASNVLNVRGVYYPVGIGAKGIETSRQDRNRPGIEKGGVFLGQKCNAPYCLVNMAMRWYHTYDLDYARKVYPFVLEVANFWEDYLRFEPFDKATGAPLPVTFAPTNSTTLPPVMTIDGVPVNEIPVSKLPPGRYVSYNDSIQETSGPDVNSVLSLGLAYNTFTLALDMSMELGVDANRREKWQHIVKNLSRFPTFEKDGVTVFRYSEKGTEWLDGNSVVIQHIYPSGAIGLDDDPKLLEIARNTIRVKGGWTNSNGENSLYPAAVRMGWDPADILAKLTTLWSTTRKMPNGLPDTMEQCSTVPNTVNEMLCMSHRQVLRIFPVWPRNRDARFLNLRAEGAFLVSSALKGGEVQYVKILSEKGRDCTVVNPWPGAAVNVYRDGRKVETLKGERIVLKTWPAGTLVLGRDGAGVPVEK